MLHVSRRLPALTALALLLLSAPALAQTGTTASDKAKEEPPYSAYKGVRIGMTADEARKLLGNPTEKDDKQEVFAVGDQESCQVYYDETKKVSALSVTYFSSKSVPAAKTVLGEEPAANQDGSFSKLIRFPKAGFWVSYTRTSGDAPMTIIAIQKLK
ncbi:MAG TPA: hypothetical protein VF588_12380 [Pyrinomonadaceae bacterium]|jgi:outer membrane protein assembly factor BamE (lipoprotein component of BamABCDE complex)